MYGIALKMLLGDRGKYLGIVVGIALASLIMIQQPGVFLSILTEQYGRITDISQPDIWVMDPNTRQVGDSKPLIDTQLFRVRSIEGVDWAMPLFQGNQTIRTNEGELVPCQILGLDDATLIGAPPVMIEGNHADLRQPDAVIVDESAANGRLARPARTPGGKPTPLRIGDSFEINDRRAVIVGICHASAPEEESALIYTTYTRVKTYASSERKFLTYILVKAKLGVPFEEIKQRIAKETGLTAYTASGFKDKTLSYTLETRPFLTNFGFTVLVGFLVGAMVTGQIFYNFTMDNLRHFGVFKAMGATNGTLLRMILLQALFVGLIGFGVGAGLCGLFDFFTRGGIEVNMLLPWQLLLGSGVAVLVICLFSAFISLRKVFNLEPAAVFKG
jgi:putative ABC transport system permease protein